MGTFVFKLSLSSNKDFVHLGLLQSTCSLSG